MQLWVNLIMDSLASLSLATEAPTDAMLDLPPYSPSKPLLSPSVSSSIPCHTGSRPHEDGPGLKCTAAVYERLLLWYGFTAAAPLKGIQLITSIHNPSR